MYYKDPLPIDHFASNIENFLTRHAKVPLLGTVPAALKIVFGAIQTVCAVTAFVGSTFFLSSITAKYIWVHSFRHILHGLSNILAGVIQAIPLIGTLTILIQENRHIGGSDCMTHYANSQSYKFFGYKTLEDTSWKKQDYDSVAISIDPGEVNIKNGKVNSAVYSI